MSLRLAFVAVALTAVAACGTDYPSTPAPTPTPTPAPGGPNVTIPAGAETLGNRAFVPDELEVAVGATVTWTNADSVTHTSTSDGNGWNSGAVAPGRQFSVAFPTAGTFPYHCTIHPGMVGKVVVR